MPDISSQSFSTSRGIPSFKVVKMTKEIVYFSNIEFFCGQCQNFKTGLSDLVSVELQKNWSHLSQRKKNWHLKTFFIVFNQQRQLLGVSTYWNRLLANSDRLTTKLLVSRLRMSGNTKVIYCFPHQSSGPLTSNQATT